MGRPRPPFPHWGTRGQLRALLGDRSRASAGGCRCPPPLPGLSPLPEGPTPAVPALSLGGGSQGPGAAAPPPPPRRARP